MNLKNKKQKYCLMIKRSHSQIRMTGFTNSYWGPLFPFKQLTQKSIVTVLCQYLTVGLHSTQSYSTSALYCQYQIIN